MKKWWKKSSVNLAKIIGVFKPKKKKKISYTFLGARRPSF